MASSGKSLLVVQLFVLTILAVKYWFFAENKNSGDKFLVAAILMR
jgi:hypothetical protein